MKHVSEAFSSSISTYSSSKLGWCHLVCAFFIPYLSFGDSRHMSEIGGFDIIPKGMRGYCTWIHFHAFIF